VECSTSIAAKRCDWPRPNNWTIRDQRWSTFLRNHARAIVACDFFVVAAWTLQQLREAISYEDGHRYLIHDRDSIFAKNLDESIGKLAMQVLKSPPRSPKANAICERVIGTIRRECLDWLILLSEPHLRSILKEWVTHYNRGRPHMSLGPGVPDPPQPPAAPLHHKSRHRIGAGLSLCVKSVLGGLHHEYSLAPTQT
jgi:putative transposase